MKIYFKLYYIPKPHKPYVLMYIEFKPHHVEKQVLVQSSNLANVKPSQYIDGDRLGMPGTVRFNMRLV